MTLSQNVLNVKSRAFGGTTFLSFVHFSQQAVVNGVEDRFLLVLILPYKYRQTRQLGVYGQARLALLESKTNHAQVKTL